MVYNVHDKKAYKALLSSHIDNIADTINSKAKKYDDLINNSIIKLKLF